MIQSLSSVIDAFRSDLRKEYGEAEGVVEQLARVYLSVWQQAREVAFLGSNPITVIPIQDQGYQWAMGLIDQIILPDLLRARCHLGHAQSWHAQGFNFAFKVPPGTDNQDLLTLIAEAMRQSGPMDWAYSISGVATDLIDSGDHLNLLRRHVWAAIAHIHEQIQQVFLAEQENLNQGKKATILRHALCSRSLYRGQFRLRQNFAPLFILSMGENLAEEALYEMQHLSYQCGCRLLVLVATQQTEVASLDFCNGKGHEIYSMLDGVGRIPVLEGADAKLYTAAIESVANLLADAESLDKDEDTLLELPIPIEAGDSLLNAFC